MGVVELNREEKKELKRLKIKSANGIATEADQERAVCAVMNAMIRNALDPGSINEAEEHFRKQRKRVEKLFPEENPLSDVPYFAIGQLGEYCISYMEELKKEIDPSVLYNFNEAESYLQYNITNYLNGYNATKNIIAEYSMQDVADAKTMEDKMRVKDTVLGYLMDAYRKKDKDTLFVVAALLNLSD